MSNFHFPIVILSVLWYNRRGVRRDAFEYCEIKERTSVLCAGKLSEGKREKHNQDRAEIGNTRTIAEIAPGPGSLGTSRSRRDEPGSGGRKAENHGFFFRDGAYPERRTASLQRRLSVFAKDVLPSAVGLYLQTDFQTARI